MFRWTSRCRQWVLVGAEALRGAHQRGSALFAQNGLEGSRPGHLGLKNGSSGRLANQPVVSVCYMRDI